MPTTNAARAAGHVALVAACAGTILAPIHALSRFATADGAGDLDSFIVRAWAVPAARWLRPLLDWSDPMTVYITYGRVWLPILLAATACAFAIRHRRDPLRLERRGWRLALPGYVLATASVVGDYWTPWMDTSFAYLGIPGMLISVVGSTVLGIALLRRRFRPRLTGWLLATWLPALVALSSLIALGAALLPMLWAWALAGRILRTDHPRPATTELPSRATSPEPV
jgi:hypothetical protein